MNKIIAAFTAALCITFIATGYSERVQADLQDNLIRLHIIADSDNDADQEIKLKVRDRVLKYISEKIDTSGDDCRDEIVNNLDEIEKIADNTLEENGFQYKSHAEYGKFEFPQKSYKSMTLPAGEYYGVRIVLGGGGGHNWWCVMYPPVCINENGEAGLGSESEKILREKLDADTYDIVTGKNDNVVVKFKLVELIQKIIH